MVDNPLLNDDPFEDIEYEINIPSDPHLEDIVNLALKAYKEHMEDTQHMEPKYRARNLEVAHRFLQLAQETLVKQKELTNADKKLIIEKIKAQIKNTDDSSSDGEKSRKELLDELN